MEEACSIHEASATWAFSCKREPGHTSRHHMLRRSCLTRSNLFWNAYAMSTTKESCTARYAPITWSSRRMGRSNSRIGWPVVRTIRTTSGSNANKSSLGTISLHSDRSLRRQPLSAKAVNPFSNANWRSSWSAWSKRIAKDSSSRWLSCWWKT